MTIIISGIAYVEPVGYTKKKDAIEELVSNRKCNYVGNDVYMNDDLVYRLIEVEVR
jgi:hypothetical protein